MSTPSNPASITHTIDAFTLRLSPDGCLLLTSQDAAPITLTPEITWALALFVKLPGAWTLIRRCELERQHERHCGEHSHDKE